MFGFAPTERCGRGKCEPVVGANVKDMVFAWQAQEMSGPKHFRNGNAAAKKQSRVLRMSRTHQEDVNFVAFGVFSMFPRRDLDRAKNADCLASSKQKLPT